MIYPELPREKLKRNVRYVEEKCVSTSHAVEAPMGTQDAMPVIGRNPYEVPYLNHSHGSHSGTLEEGHAFTGDKKEAD